MKGGGLEEWQKKKNKKKKKKKKQIGLLKSENSNQRFGNEINIFVFSVAPGGRWSALDMQNKGFVRCGTGAVRTGLGGGREVGKGMRMRGFGDGEVAGDVGSSGNELVMCWRCSDDVLAMFR